MYPPANSILRFLTFEFLNMTAYDLEVDRMSIVVNIEISDVGLILINRGIKIGKTIKKIRNVADTYYVDIGGNPFIFRSGRTITPVAAGTADLPVEQPANPHFIP